MGQVVSTAVLAFCLWWIVDARSAPGQVAFEEVGAARGIGPYMMADGPVGGIAAADFDGDGDIDLFVPNGLGAADQLYLNLGPGVFQEIAASVGLASLSNNRAALWFDADGDHRLDLVVGGDCRTTFNDNTPCPDPVNLRLYRQNDTGTFDDVTVASGLYASWGGLHSSHRSGFAAGDINNDGFLDLYVCSWNDRAYMYLNDGDGTFTDIAATCGFTEAVFLHHQPIMHDFNRDGWLDIYVSVDALVGNFLWINQGDNTFVDQAASAGVDHAWTDMGVTLGDYDTDGDLDLFVTNITYPTGGDHNVFYRNDSTPAALSFAEISEQLGVAETGFGWGTTFLDCDRDGRLDLAVTNGKDNFVGGLFSDDPSRFFFNLGGTPVQFLDVSDFVQFNDTHVAAALVAFDADRDGDLDLAQSCTFGGPLRLLVNSPDPQQSSNHSLVVRPRMRGANHFAIGAVVRVTTDGDPAQMRLITAGTSTIGQEPAEAFFGLGSATSGDVVIEWPGGRQTIRIAVASDQVITIFECAEDFDGSGQVNVLDLIQLFGAWGSDEPAFDIAPLAPAVPDGVVDMRDLLATLAAWGSCDG